MEENFNPVAQTRANYYTPGMLFFLSGGVNIFFCFRPYLSICYGLYPLYFISVYIWYVTKVKWFPCHTANSGNRA